MQALLSEFAVVLGVLMDTEPNFLAENFIKLVEVFLVFRDLDDEDEGLLDRGPCG